MGSANPMPPYEQINLCPVSACSPHEEPTNSKSALNRLYLATVLCTIFMIAEWIGGIISGSLAVQTDAVHLLSDVAGFLTSVVAIKVSQKRPSGTLTYGFQRAQTVGALLSIATVWVLTWYLIVEAIERFRNPQIINGRLMFIIAALGLFINIILAKTLHHQHHHDDSGHHDHSHNQNENINVRAALIHVIGDLIQSVGVLIASGLVWYNEKWIIADPICTVLFSVIVFGTTLFILKEIMLVFMEAAPKNINSTDVFNDITQIEGVIRVHDLHIWVLSPGNTALTVHVVVESGKVDQANEILTQVQNLVCSKYRIHHATIQIESTEGIHCEPAFCKK